MADGNWYRERNDRSLRYAGRVLPPERPIILKVSPQYATRYDGQVAVLVAANLLARMTPAVAFDVPDADIVAPLPWAGARLRHQLTEAAFAADPTGFFSLRGIQQGDYVLSLGPESASAAVHGSGWNAYVGAGPSRLSSSEDPNPIGPAFAAIIAVSRLFALQMGPMDGPHLFNALTWQTGATTAATAASFDPERQLGSLWAIGVGSVGTAVLYFLTMLTNRFSATLFDMDFVKVQNLDRSPIFSAADAQNRLRKIEATETYLRSVGVQDIATEKDPLDRSRVWFAREAGTPDLLISAANERNVRYVIEKSLPPLQIYGTTGANWEASVIRHTPLTDPCSCCLFPPEIPQAATICATDTVISQETGESVDAALPFLSFAAGLMAAAEILKTGLPGYPLSPNRTTFYTHPAARPRFISPSLRRRETCLCGSRNPALHRRMISGTRYEFLSFK
jgi:hypothetical protein